MYHNRSTEYMSIELQTSAAGLHLQDEEKSEEMLKNVEQEKNAHAAMIL